MRWFPNRRRAAPPPGAPGICPIPQPPSLRALPSDEGGNLEAVQFLRAWIARNTPPQGDPVGRMRAHLWLATMMQEGIVPDAVGRRLHDEMVQAWGGGGGFDPSHPPCHVSDWQEPSPKGGRRATNS